MQTAVSASSPVLSHIQTIGRDERAIARKHSVKAAAEAHTRRSPSGSISVGVRRAGSPAMAHDTARAPQRVEAPARPSGDARQQEPEPPASTAQTVAPDRSSPLAPLGGTVAQPSAPKLAKPRAKVRFHESSLEAMSDGASKGAAPRGHSGPSLVSPVNALPAASSRASPPPEANARGDMPRVVLDLPPVSVNTTDTSTGTSTSTSAAKKIIRPRPALRSASHGHGSAAETHLSVPDAVPNMPAIPPLSRSPDFPPAAPPSVRPVLNRYYSTPMNPMSPARQQLRLHNPVPHHVKETPIIRVLEDARGRFINQYQITRVVGRGSFGMVYLAVDPQGQRYALKECSKRRLAKLNRAALMRLRRQIVANGSAAATTGEISSIITREIAVMKKLDHPNLVTLFEVLDDADSESLILVLEWCPGGTIMPSEEDYSDETKAIPEPKCRLYFRDLILGVEYLHARGVCHRDIKADNVLLGEGDVVKIADFGVSEIFDLSTNQEDSVQRPVGSPAYMSPELVLLQCGPSAFAKDGQKNLPPRYLHPAHAPISGRKADIWAMGVTLYYMVHGRLPFEASDLSGLHLSILTTEPDLSTCTPELADLFRRIFKKSPMERITLQELREHKWVTQNGLDYLLPVEENIQVSDNDRITEEDLRDAIESIEHRIGSPKLDFRMVSNSLRTNYGWHGSKDSSVVSSGMSTPSPLDVNAGAPQTPQQESSKMAKLARALEELFHFQEDK